MAVTYITASNIYAGTSLSFNAYSNTYEHVMLLAGITKCTPTVVTYGGIPLTNVGNSGSCHFWVLPDPPEGTNTLYMNATGHACISSYYNVEPKIAGVRTASNGTSGTRYVSGTFSSTLSTDMIVGVCYTSDNSTKPSCTHGTGYGRNYQISCGRIAGNGGSEYVQFVVEDSGINLVALLLNEYYPKGKIFHIPPMPIG